MPKNERRNITYVDPLFSKPSDHNIKDIEVGNPESSGGQMITGTLGAVPNITSPTGGANWVTSMIVAEQNMHSHADGTHTVDVVVVIDDIPGAVNFNVRVSLLGPY